MPKTLMPERQWPRPNAWQKTGSKSNFQQKKNSFGFRDATLDNGCLASARRIATHPKEWDMKPQQVKPQQAKRSQLSQLPFTPSQNPEAFVFLACVLRLTDNAANLFNAFFHNLGLSGAGLPPEFMLELGALLLFREWHQTGVIPWQAPDGGTIDDQIALTIKQHAEDPWEFFNKQRGTEAMVSMLRAWTKKCWPVAREHFGCEIAIQSDRSFNIEHIIDNLSELILNIGCLVLGRRIGPHPKEWDTKPQQLSQPPLTHSQNPEAIAEAAYSTALAADSKTLLNRLGFDDNWLEDCIASRYLFELKAIVQMVRWYEIGLLIPYELNLPYPQLLMIDLRKRIAASPATHVASLVMDDTIIRMRTWWKQHTITSSWQSVQAHVRMSNPPQDLADAFADFLWDTREILTNTPSTNCTIGGKP